MGRNKLRIRKKWVENVWENNQKTALNVLYVKEMDICPTYISKTNQLWKKSWGLSKRWHYVAVKYYQYY